MSMNNKIGLKDWIEAIVFDPYGEVKAFHFGEDLITSAGKAEVAALLCTDVASDEFDYIAIGSGSTAASTGDTALEKEFDRAAGTGSRTTTTVTNDTMQMLYLFSSGNPAGCNGYSTGSRNIRESGLLNAASSGDLLCRQVFAALNIDWDSGDTLQITWKIQVS